MPIENKADALIALREVNDENEQLRALIAELEAEVGRARMQADRDAQALADEVERACRAEAEVARLRTVEDAARALPWAAEYDTDRARHFIRTGGPKSVWGSQEFDALGAALRGEGE